MAAKAGTLVLSLAAFCLSAAANVPGSVVVVEKPHQGGARFGLGSLRGEVAAKPLIAAGFGGCFRDSGSGSRSTGKERDAETGLDYFGGSVHVQRSGAVYFTRHPINRSACWRSDSSLSGWDEGEDQGEMTVLLNTLMGKLQSKIDWSGPSQRIQTTAAMPADLTAILHAHNGLSAFSGGLRIFGASTSLLHGISDWNQELLWRCEFRGLCDGLTFFGEDVFGNQFGFADTGEIVRFLAETGDREPCGRDLYDWLDRTLAGPEDELSLWLLGDWNRSGIPVRLSQHLCPKVPFVAHGPYESANLYTCGRVESMRFKGSFANQVRNLPTGTAIEIKVR